MRLLINPIAAIAIILAATSAHATSALSFEAKGYLLDIVVGDASGPVIAGLGFVSPGSTQATRLPESFHLTVKDGVGTLRMGKNKSKALVGSFAWGE